MTKPLIALVALGLSFAARAQQNNPSPADAAVETNAAAADDQQQIVGQLIQAVVDAQQATNGEQPVEGEAGKPAESGVARPIRGQGTRGTAGSGTNAVSLTALVAEQSTNHIAGAAKLLRLNFRNAPLSMVLDYLSDAAGFTISANSKVDLKGTVTVWSNHPVTRNEAIQILDDALTASGYGATVEGNVLNIFVVDATNAKIIAGVPNNDYTNIAPTKDLVTQIVYVRNVEAGPLITSLQPLLPPGTTMTANQGANAIVLTDTKANIRRMVQLVKALDTPSVSATTVRVFPLTYADATALAQVVQQLFQGTDANSTQPGGRFAQFFGRFGPGGNRGQPDNANNTPAGRVAAAKVTAVADDRSNSLVVSASEDQMALVEKLVNQMDVNVDDLTEVRVFRLLYADPQETADQLANLFPDPATQQTANTRGGSRFGGSFPFNRGRSSNATGTDPNSRKFTEARVTAVPDPRTGSVIVSASHDMMAQIADIIEKLDSDPAKKKQVYVIKVENRDPQDVVNELQSVIATDNNGNYSATRSSSQQSGSQLNMRQQNNLRNQGNNSSSFLNNGTSGNRTGR